ncbi:MAG: hypothetical protein HRT41_08330 [Campylobacteraceae bacterium]|nr:hypothetical protein [Campylobacteraceae bacterium]
MDSLEIFIHSWMRWLVCFGVIANLALAYYGYFANKRFTLFNKIFSHVSVAFVHIQFISGLILYYNSEITSMFFADMKGSMSNLEVRYFSIEHSLLMLIAVVLITVGSFKAKRIQGDKNKFKTLMIYFTLACILILVAIPWEFSPYVQRPLFSS